MEKIIILGASGSIGTQTQDILLDNPDDFTLVGVSVGHNIKVLKETLNKFPSIKYVTVQEHDDLIKLEKEYDHITFFEGDEGLIRLIDESKCTFVVNSLVGFVGFLPSLHTVEKGLTLALANKESLVVGGSLIKKALKEHGGHLYAIDSEHCALAKCLEGHKREDIKNLVITASGGSFRDLPKDQLEDVTIEQALHHPSWSMGSKITIDSATMMNKGFEIMEAMHLFDYPLEQVKVLLHDESIIHSLVEFKDQSFVCDIGPTNMKIAIGYALYRNTRKFVNVEPLDFTKLSGLHFRSLDMDRYPCLKLAYQAIKTGGTAPCVLNRSNEEAVHSFLRGEIKFTEISLVIEKCLNAHQVITNPTKEDIVLSDHWAKKQSQETIRSLIK